MVPAAPSIGWWKPAATAASTCWTRALRGSLVGEIGQGLSLGVTGVTLSGAFVSA